MTRYDIFNSPIGQITIAANNTAIIALHIEGDRYFTGCPEDWQRDPNNALLQQAHREIDEYFAGTRTSFDVPLEMEGTTFQKSVWSAIKDISFGNTESYADVARKVGKPNAVRAVGTAIGRNPICLITPCHRVRTSTGGLGGYVAGTERKEYLLALEGTI